MSRRLVLLHSVPSLIGLFTDLGKAILPGDVEVWHIADEMLAKIVNAEGRLTPFLYRRVADHVTAAEQAGATVMMFTCSSISPCADVVRLLVRIPVLKVDEPMVDKAISLGSRIAVAATAPTALRPVTELVYARADHAGKSVRVTSVLCEGAYDALFTGNRAKHDGIVIGYLGELMTEVDVILLAQASMARALDAVPTSERRVPVLSSPRLAVESVRDVLDQVAM